MNSDMSQVKVSKKRKQTLIAKYVIILFIFIIACFATLCIVSSNSVKNDSISVYEDFSATVTEKSAELISSWVEGLKKEMRVYTEADTFRRGNISEMATFIEENTQLMSEEFNYVGIAGPDGIMHTSTGNTADIKDRDYFQAIMNEEKYLFIDNPSKSRTNQITVFHIALPVLDYDGNRVAMFCSAISIENLQDVVNSIKLGESGFAYALSGDGTTIAHPTKEYVMKNTYNDSSQNADFEGLKEISTAMINGETGAGTVFNKRINVKNRVFFHPIDGTPWSLALSIPFSQVYKSAVKTGTFITFFSIAIAVVILLFSSIYLHILLRPLNRVKNNISEIATGEADLTKRIETKSDDEIGEVVKGFNMFTEKLHNIISRIKNAKDNLQIVDNKMQESIQETGSSITQILSNIDSVTNQITNQSASVEETAGAVTEIAQNIESLNRMIETQASGVTQASAAVEEMIGNINSVTTSMDHMADAFSNLEKHTRTGVEKQNDVNGRITQIEEQSKMLFDANKAISEIASQTNLLAMNAAIEAAHAGDAGKGFSVVADEIRKLSETSTSQSKTIGSELKKIQASITSVVSASLEAQKSFNAVNSSIKETDELVQQIKGAMIESQEGSKQITDALKMMNDSTVEVRTASTEMSEGNKAILEEVKHLQDATMMMKDSIGEMSQGAKHINEQGSTLANVSGTMEDSINGIGKEIDLFKV